jgi:hypothetical protein
MSPTLISFSSRIPPKVSIIYTFIISFNEVGD